YLASPRRRAKLRFAQAFASGAESSGAKVALATTPDRDGIASTAQPWWARWFGSGWPAWAFAVAAVVALIATVYLAVQNLRLGGEMAQAHQDRASLEQREQELERQIEDNRSESTKTADELAQVRERLAQLERDAALGPHANQGHGRDDLQVVALTLAPPTRSISTIPVLALPRRSGEVVLTLKLEADDFPGYRAAIKDSGTGSVVLQRGPLKPTSKGQKTTISVRFRPGLLKQGVYNVEVAGLRQGGGAEVIASYPFRVVIQYLPPHHKTSGPCRPGYCDVVARTNLLAH